jgi:hypothetical protein
MKRLLQRHGVDVVTDGWSEPDGVPDNGKRLGGGAQ